MTFSTKGLYLHTTYVNLIFTQPNLQESFDTEQVQNLVAHFQFGTMETDLTPPPLVHLGDKKYSHSLIYNSQSFNKLLKMTLIRLIS